MIRVGIVGIGFMGRIHTLAARRVPGLTVAAVCSRDAAKRAGDWRQTRGNFGPEPGAVDLTGVAAYAEYADLLADPSVDVVNLCNPTHLHPETAIAALEAGKHVFVEKAIALTPAGADRMVAAAERSGRLLMVGHVLPFFPEFAEALRFARAGEGGALLGGHFTRVIARPDWSADIADAAKTGGPAVDLHVHDTHFIRLLCGLPRAVFSVGRRESGGGAESVPYLATSYLYGDGGPAVSCASGAIAAAGRPFAHGFELYFETATLAYHSGGQALTVYPARGEPYQPALSSSDPLDAFAAELAAMARGVEAGRAPDELSAALARDALVLCHAEVESVRTGRLVELRGSGEDRPKSAG